MAQVALMAEHAVDFNNLLADLLGLIHRIAIAQAVPDAVDNSQGDKEQVMALAQAISSSQIQLMYQIALTGKRDLPLAPDARSGMEMTLLRILNFSPITDQAGVAPAAGAPPAKKPDLAQLKGQLASGLPTTAANTVEPVATQAAPVSSVQASVAPEPVAAQQAYVSEPPPWDIGETPVSKPAPVTQVIADAPQNVTPFQQAPQAVAVQQPVHVAPQQTAPAYVEPVMDDGPAEPYPVAEPKPAFETQQSAYEAQQSQAVVTKPEPVVEAASVVVEAQPDHSEILAMPLSSQSWPMIFEVLALDGMLRNLVANTCLMTVNGNELLFHGDAGHMRLFNVNHQQTFAQVLNQALGHNYQLQVIEGPIQFETPAQRQQRLTAEKQQAAIESIEQDANVQALRQAFNAQVIMDSITPLA